MSQLESCAPAQLGQGVQARRLHQGALRRPRSGRSRWWLSLLLLHNHGFIQNVAGEVWADVSSLRGFGEQSPGGGVLPGSPFRCRSPCVPREHPPAEDRCFLCRVAGVSQTLAAKEGTGRGLGRWGLCRSKAWEPPTGRGSVSCRLFDSLTAVFAHRRHALRVEKGPEGKAGSEGNRRGRQPESWPEDGRPGFV